MKAQQEASIRHGGVVGKEQVRLPERVRLRFGSKHPEVRDAAVIHMDVKNMAGARGGEQVAEGILDYGI